MNEPPYKNKNPNPPLRPPPRNVAIIDSDDSVVYANNLFEAIDARIGAEAAAEWERFGPDAIDPGTRPYRGAFLRLYHPVTIGGECFRPWTVVTGREGQKEYNWDPVEKKWSVINEASKLDSELWTSSDIERLILPGG